MKEFQEILKEKRDYYGNTEAAIEFAAEEYLRQARISILESVKFGFDICSDHSTLCLGYRNLVDRIRREKANEPMDWSISPIKPYDASVKMPIDEKTVEKCKYYDCAQGRHKCFNIEVKSSRCKGICDKYKE